MFEIGFISIKINVDKNKKKDFIKLKHYRFLCIFHETGGGDTVQ